MVKLSFEMNKYIFCLVLITCQLGFAQIKLEKEERIKEVDVPLKAVQFMDSFCQDCNVKWYKEYGLNSISFEAKFKRNKIKYSIEFAANGTLEDVETEISFDAIESVSQKAIISAINQECRTFIIEKVQHQITGDENIIANHFKGLVVNSELTEKYELVVRCKYKSDVSLIELLFNQRGVLESKSIIVNKNSSHLEY